MDTYSKLSRQTSQLFTDGYSTSFGLASKLFAASIRADIYAIYGLVRLADEIVDTYKGPDAEQLLNDLEAETYAALQRGYSVNPLVQAFQQTALAYHIDKPLLKPFFASMRTDITAQSFTKQAYETYIYGSAEVVGLMCLKVFVVGDHAAYRQLKAPAQRLGAAYQKVNFLRDLAADQTDLQRFYFPGTTYAAFSDDDKATVIADIAADFAAAQPALSQLPKTAQKAVTASYQYYYELFNKLKAAPVADVKRRRYRINDARKVQLLVKTLLRRSL